MRNEAIGELTEIARNNPDIVLINGDLGFGVLDEFEKQFPERFINAGICEQNMIGVAAGIALTGRTVFVYSLSNFPVMRCLEQIRNDVCYNNLNVKIIAVGGGFSYGELGMTHHATEDLAITRALPNMHVYTPADAKDAIEAIRDSIKVEGPCYIRLGRGREPDVVRAPGCNGTLQEIIPGTDLVIISVGPVICESIKASSLLKEKGISLAVYDLARLKPLPEEEIEKILLAHHTVITLEEHNIIGGLGSALSELITSRGLSCKLIRLGLRDCYTSVVGSPAYLREYYNMSYKDIVKIAESVVIR